MVSTIKRYALVAAAVLATAACAVHDQDAPGLNGPSQLAVALNVDALPDVINQDGGSQSAIRVTAIGPDGRPIPSLSMRVDMSVNGSLGDFGTLSARTIVTDSNGVARVVYTAPPSPTNGVFGTCRNLPGTCVSIIATATGTNFSAANPQSVTIRLAPPGVILPPTIAPVATFSVNPQTPSANSPVQFDATGSCGGPLSGSSCPASSPNITSYSWNFGDGATATGRTATHAFALQQTYTVTLTVTNELGAQGSKSQVVSVGSGSLPTANFTFSPTQPGVGEPVFFSGLGSTPGQGHTLSSYRWTFGDGGTGSGATVSHAYGSAGTYSVQLTVVDDSGQSTTSGSQTVSVGNPPTPTANFTFSPTNPIVGDTVVFDWRTSTTAQGQRIVTLDWNFGDDTPVVHCPGDPACTSDGITTHVFSRGGTFVVNLVVTDSAGRTSTKSTTVAVGSGNPVAAFTAAVGNAAAHRMVFDASGSAAAQGSTITQYQWAFGDGTFAGPSSSPTATHDFPATGSYTVRVTVTDDKGRTGTLSTSVAVP
jgi:PKD repeat protein